MQIEYTAVAKNQKNNPYWKLRSRDQAMLEKALQDRLIFICQLGASKQKLDMDVYEILAKVTSKEDFGSSPDYGNQPNTGLAALAGALDKLRRGDLSQKQIKYITPTLDLLAKAYPRQFSEITFVERELVEVNVNLPLSHLFEVLDGE